MIGQRGIPASFGGVERHVEELGARLVERGHEVTVFVRPNYTEEPLDEYRGMNIQTVRTVNSKHLDAIVHAGASTFVATRGNFDIVHYHAQGPGVPSVIPRYFTGSKVVQTIHGLDSQRAKWGGAAQRMLSGAEWLSARVPDATIVVSQALADHYLEQHGRATYPIPNGVSIPQRRPADEIVTRFGLEAKSYILFVGRFVPEKAPDLLIESFGNLETDVKLVLAGGSSFTDEFVAGLEELAEQDPRVIMPGYVYGDLLDELYTNAAFFVLPSNLEGLPLTLLEAASYGIPIVASDIPPHVEVMGESGPGHRLFATGDGGALTETMGSVLDSLAEEQVGATEFGRGVVEHFTWDAATEATEAVYLDALAGTAR